MYRVTWIERNTMGGNRNDTQECLSEVEAAALVKRLLADETDGTPSNVCSIGIDLVPEEG